VSSLRGYSSTVGPLTPRQRAVLVSAAAGRTAAETALELIVSEATVRSIRASACARLEAPNIVAAVATALRRGELR
jgi:DNA-binding CsgD family transcriptional regulator